MSLHVLAIRLERQLDELGQYLRDFATSKRQVQVATSYSVLDECLLEGLLSRIWQAWGLFCRQCVMESCIGTVDAYGVDIAPAPGATTEDHVSWAAVRAKNKASAPPYWGGTNTVLRYEPTWGDVDVLVRLLPRLAPANSTRLLAAFSASSESAKALQAIRNCAAHNHAQTLQGVLDLRPKYQVFPVSHPTQALFWIEPASSDFLAIAAIRDLKDASLSAVI